jgi:hypothetical protein
MLVSFCLNMVKSKKNKKIVGSILYSIDGVDDAPGPSHASRRNSLLRLPMCFHAETFVPDLVGSSSSKVATKSNPRLYLFACF